MTAVPFCCQNCGEVQHCQIAGPVQRPEGAENQQRGRGEGGGHQHQHPAAPGHAAQHDGAQLPPALQADLRPHPAALHRVSAPKSLPPAGSCHLRRLWESQAE